MPSSTQAEADHSVTRVPLHVTTHQTTAAERKAEREKLSNDSQENFDSEPISSGNRIIMVADQTPDESVAVEKAQKKMEKKMGHILDKYKQG